MLPYGYTIWTGAAVTAALMAQRDALLRRLALRPESCGQTVCVCPPSGQVAACGSLDGQVIKCVGVAPEEEGNGLAAEVVTALTRLALEQGETRLLLYTKPKNRTVFEGCGFHLLAQCSDALLMERPSGGLARFLEKIPRFPAQARVGVVVMNCNPMTAGHLYLIEQARSRCDGLYVFVLSEDRSAVPAADRLAIVREMCVQMPDVTVWPTGPYLISAATFPAYFLREADPSDVWCSMDIAVFAQHFAPALHIGVRFAGTEPESAVTAAYNRALARSLPQAGIVFTEIERLGADGRPVSASTVRRLAVRFSKGFSAR